MKNRVRVEELTKVVIFARGPECSVIFDYLRKILYLVNSETEEQMTLTIKNRENDNFEIIIARKEKGNE